MQALVTRSHKTKRKGEGKAADVVKGIRSKQRRYFMDNEKGTASLKKQKMSTIGVVALIFSFVAAGAFGIEEAISASGPGATLLMLLIFPLIWSFPLCEMVGELGSIFPNEGGVYAWGRASYGEFWGWQIGWWSGITTWISQAQYCVLVAGYISKIFELTTFTEWGIKIGMVLIFTIINIIGLKSIEKLETVFNVAVLIAFAAVTVVGFMNWNYNPIEPFFNPDEGVFSSFGSGIAIIIWMYSGYECMSNMAEEMENPQIIPKAMRISQPVVALSYILPTLAALAALGQWDAWSTEQSAGYIGYADVLIQYVGGWAGTLFVIVAVISNMGIFCSYIAHGSRAFFVMADDHMFPLILRKVDKRGIPTISIILLGIFTVICCKFDFTALVMAATPINLYIYLFLVLTLFKLRKMYPIEERRKMGLTVMPGGKSVLVVLMGCVIFICMFAIYANGTDYFVTGFLALALGLVLYIIFKWIYKGNYITDPENYPLNPKTKLGVGDMADIGMYILLTGVMALGGTVFLYFYEGSWGPEYYIEEYETGIFSSFEGMLQICLAIGVVCVIAGYAIYRYGKKTEGAQVKALEASRKLIVDEELRELIGAVPGVDDLDHFDR